MKQLQAAGVRNQFDAAADLSESTDLLPARDLFTVARYLVPTEAFLAQGCLVAGGVPAVLADANHVQADQLIASAIGGVRVLVPEAYVQQSKAMLEALERGDYALDDDFDVGTPL